MLRNKAFKIASDPKYDGYQRGLASMVYSFLIKSLKKVVLMNQIINWLMNYISLLLKKNKKRKVYSSFRDNIWGVDLADMQ